MKNKTLTILFVLFVSRSLAFSQSLAITFTTKTVTTSGATKYSPKHVLAAWIETSSGTFVSSVMVYAQQRIGDLIVWSAKSKNSKVNAVTGATLSSHGERSVTWNCKNYNGVTISEGDYKLFIEETSNDAAGPYSEVPFTIGSTSFTTNPSDGTTFTGMTLSFTPASSTYTTTSSTTTTNTESDIWQTSQQNVLRAIPTPFTEFTTIQIYTPSNEYYQLTIINTKGETVTSQQIKGIDGKIVEYKWSGCNDNGIKLSSGTYFCIVSGKGYKVSCKVFKM